MLNELEQILREYFGDDDLKITTQTSLSSDLKINSLDLINLLLIMEDEIGIKIPDKALMEFKTVGDVVEYIESNR